MSELVEDIVKDEGAAVLFRIAAMTKDDVEAVKALEVQCNLAPWSVEDYKKELLRADAITIVAKKEEEVIGFALARLITIIIDKKRSNTYKEIELYNIAVTPNTQNKGIGSALLNALLTHPSSQPVAKVWLEVRQSNDIAIRFYKKNGFNPAYFRNNFYSAPLENAIVMELNVSSFDEISGYYDGSYDKLA